MLRLLLLLSSSLHANAMKAVVAQGGECVVQDKPTPVVKPGSCQMLIKVFATALNRADTLQRRGKYPPPAGVTSTLGLELAGEVLTLPECENSRNTFKKGDRVMSLVAGGGYAEFAVVEADLTMKMPASLTMVQAASIPEVWLTAFQILNLVGQLSPTDKVLVHAGGSGVGLAAVQLATKAGATVYVTAGTSVKIEEAKRLGAKQGFNYKESNFAEEVRFACVN